MAGSTAAPPPRPASRLREWCHRLLLLGVALAFVFAALEIAVRLAVDLDRERPHHVRDVHSDRLSFLPGVERRYETSEFSFTVRTNSLGRRDREWPPSVVSDPDNILMIGDSFVFGFGFDDAETIPGRIERRLSAANGTVEVFNYGMPGAGPPDYNDLFEHAVAAGIAARRVVVVVFVGNDFYPRYAIPAGRSMPPWNPAEATSPRTLRHRSRLLHLLELRASRSPRTIGWLFALGRRLGIDVYDTAGAYIFLTEPSQRQQATFDSILGHLAETRRLAARYNRELVFVMLPNRIQVENSADLASSRLDPDRPNRLLSDYCRDNGLDCIDLLPALRRQWRTSGRPLYFAIDRHLNDAGSELVASRIAEALGG